MQREKLYNLHTDSLFYNCAFCFQNRQTSERLNFVAAEKSFVLVDECVFSLFVTWDFFLKQNTLQDEA
jgi:hypothetical protein